jgi:ATP-binding cassette subfamily B protein
VRRLATFAPWLYLASGLLASTLFYLLPLLPGLVTRRYFDQLSGDAPATFSEWTLGAALLTLALVRAAQLTGATAAETTLNQTHAALMRKNMLQRILERPAAGWEPPAAPPSGPPSPPGSPPGSQGVPSPPGASTTGETLSRFRDDVTHIAGFMSWTLDPLGQSLMYLTALVVLLRIDARLTLAVFLPLLLMLLVVRLATARIQRYRREAQEAIGGVTGLLGELFGAVLAVKVAGAEERIVERLRARGEARRRATLRDLLFTQLLGTVSYNTASLATGVILLVAGQSLQAGTLTVGDFALFLSYLAWLTQMTGFFGNFVTKIRQVGVSFDRAAALVMVGGTGAPGEGGTGAKPPEKESPAQDDGRLRLVRHGPVYLRGPLPPVPAPKRPPGDALRTLEAQGLTYHHPGSGRGVGGGAVAQRGGQRAGRGIEGIDLTLRRGTLTVITGRVGAGKSTLLRTLLGLLPAQAGQVLWNGEPVRDGPAFFLPPRAAYTPQTPRLFSESLEDNLLLGLDPQLADLPRALRLAVLEEDVQSFPTGLATPIGPRGVRLSGGQAQRAGAARMFVRRPELLVVDDLSSALDAATERELWVRLSAEPDRTCLAVSHRRGALRRADQVVVLAGGRVLAQGPLPLLLETCAEMRALWQGEEVREEDVEGDALRAAR